MRTIRNTFTFRHSFVLAGMDRQRPVGDYVVDSDEEPTHVGSRAVGHGANSIEMVEVNALEPASALACGELVGPNLRQGRTA